jgi:peptidoglycan/xylan/chitin deacetylase (PgdA/CDA1 family)
MAKAGHYVGPHSDKHLLYCSWETPARTLVTRAQFQADLEANLRELEAAGVPRAPVRWFLPAYEHANADIVRWTQESGLTLVNYTAGTRSAADYTGENDPDFVSSRAIVESVLLREKTDEHGLNGFLLLSHLGAGPGRKDKLHACLGELLEALAGRGYGFVRLDELLAPER